MKNDRQPLWKRVLVVALALALLTLVPSARLVVPLSPVLV